MRSGMKSDNEDLPAELSPAGDAESNHLAALVIGSRRTSKLDIDVVADRFAANRDRQIVLLCMPMQNRLIFVGLPI
ncbi:hypothetical protein SKAU_G00292010 [Synaphobranchus kaupii]|uniref:Uncharacterized protein n=1 Tax=Synaphobranchus kaupii TaxID=118154 RepID=A0A9Q1ETZ7_SYNKA|nr:hypothetical protein SKAU_G00292010 [Synaphobranchus kaupii]